MNPIDTTKPTSDTPLRVFRGGCWHIYAPSWVRTASRNSREPAFRFDYLGFRTRLSVRSPRV